jgi:hypothetical protein
VATRVTMRVVVITPLKVTSSQNLRVYQVP